ncbi:MAG: DUF63 family protein [Candidatus Nanohaloarchaea archaeon]|nr:DUF63 family protein [Candidatus Nanohaloarchaea archaeon]
MLRFLEDTGELPFLIRPFLITPVIYLVIAVLYLDSFGLALRYTSTEEERNRMLLKTGSAVLAVPVIAALYYVLVRDTGYDRTGFHLAAFSQFFGGAVSMIGVTQGYTQKQLLAQFSTQLLGSPGILVFKSAVLAAALYIATDPDRVTKALLVLALTVVGLATGLRVYLRMIAGI